MTSIFVHNKTIAEKQKWAVRLFNKSVLKQRKFNEIIKLLGPPEQRKCLDIGSDNGVISYMLRRRGGKWKSADLDADSVSAIRNLVMAEVYQIDEDSTPFKDNEFDCAIIVDFLEHIADDAGFIDEMFRIIKPGGGLIINVPHIKVGFLRKFRLFLGQTDERHGHLRPGYSIMSIEQLVGEKFSIEHYRTYSKFFSEFIDTLIVQLLHIIQQKKRVQSAKGVIVTGEDLQNYQKSFRLYSLVYPFIWMLSKLDAFLFFTSGYMLIIKARSKK
jgi:SAM-dependent methyltransferase